MEIIVAKHAGFCFGVKNALDTVYKSIDSNHKIVTLGPVIHNNQVIDELNRKGVSIIEKIEDLEQKSGENNIKVVIRSHGIGKYIYDRASEKSIDVIDCTCPFVKKIHQKVEKYYSLGYRIIIIGDPNHPEVIGINGWCDNSAIIINSVEEVGALNNHNKACVVAQTTITTKKWNDIVYLLKQNIDDIIFFNTICNATSERQSSTIQLAKEVDAMIIVGGLHSSNTKKLFEVSKEYCLNTFHIETIEQLNIGIIKLYNKIGITAGASTPDSIIKEVVLKLVNNGYNENEQFNMMEEIDKSFNILRDGDRVIGKVIHVSNEEVLVNVNYKSDGIILKNEITDDPDVNIKDMVKVGDEIEVVVLRVNDGDGNVVLSKKRAELDKNWDKLEESQQGNKVFDAKVISTVKGGVIALVNGLRAFIPASQLDSKFVTDLNQYVGRTLKTEIIEVNREKGKIVLSAKALAQKEAQSKKEAVWKDLEVGQVRKGVVRRLTDFGAFVDLGGVDGLVHISDLSWNRVKHPSQVVKENQEIEVQVLEINKDKDRISLGLKQTTQSPWAAFANKYNVGDIVKVKISNITNFGAFAEIIPGVEGLIHISQLSDKHVNKVTDVVNTGDIVDVKIIEVNLDERKISLSKKEAENKEITE